MTTSEGTLAEVLSGDARWCVICADALDVLPTMADGCVDHVVTDPPYEAEAHKLSRRSHRGPAGDRGGFCEFPIDFAAMDPHTRAAVGESFSRIVRRWCLVFCQLEGARPWRDACSGLRHMRTCVWVKPDGAPQFTGDRPGTGYECIEALHVPAASRWNGGGRRGVFVHNCASQKRDPEEDHQTPKPLPLMEELVSLFTDPNDLILDPFAGSGATGVAALRLGRRCILIEREPRWAELSRERLRAEEQNTTLAAVRAGQMALFGGGE